MRLSFWNIINFTDLYYVKKEWHLRESLNCYYVHRTAVGQVCRYRLLISTPEFVNLDPSDACLQIFKSRFWPIFRVRRWMKMATRRSLLQNESSSPSHANDPGRDLFEACRNGGLNKVKKLVQSDNVNAKDTREESHDLHFSWYGWRQIK